MICPRCQGIINEHQTKVLINDVPYHFYCGWRIEEEKKEARLKEQEQQTQERRKFLTGG